MIKKKLKNIGIKSILLIIITLLLSVALVSCMPGEDQVYVNSTVDIAKQSVKEITEDIMKKENIEQSYTFFKEQYELIQATKSQIETLETSRTNLLRNMEELSPNYIKIKTAKLDEEILNKKLKLDKFIQDYNEKAKSEKHGLFVNKLPTTIDEVTYAAVMLTEEEYQNELENKLKENEIEYINQN